MWLWLAGIGLHTGCKGVSGYSYHYWFLGAIITGSIVVCLEKKKGSSWCEVDAGYLPSDSLPGYLPSGLMRLGGNSRTGVTGKHLGV